MRASLLVWFLVVRHVANVLNLDRLAEIGSVLTRTVCQPGKSSPRCISIGRKQAVEVG